MEHCKRAVKLMHDYTSIFINSIRTIVSVIALSFLIAGCSQSLSDYKQTTPAFDLKQYFDGDIKAWGLVTDRNGLVKRRFTATINASWQGDQGVLDESFEFDDGERQHRLWRLTKIGDQYTGSAGDVVGEAAGSVVGFAMNWQYQLMIEVDGEPWTVGVNDWLYQLDDDVVINIGKLTKFGIEVGQITLFMQKQS
ncbi:DUF3833 domain-containing protein [Neiella marina]|uniref:DUF3833 domain-containing protein n=1 Tax=Neiella holothuriorum TaxID=2870530 RepID=A0ABS7EHX2_9GAMM|nr:DUF3833 domain-containing protein [Neiella holothuriorum]MBW8191920.1 DUF3833 domain-containing protein [Neiella holothuriorum]